MSTDRRVDNSVDCRYTRSVPVSQTPWLKEVRQMRTYHMIPIIYKVLTQTELR